MTTTQNEKREKYMRMLTQDEAAYVTLSANNQQACANCRWFAPNVVSYEGATPADICHLVDCYPEEIMPTGWCKRWEAKPNERVPAPLEVIIVEDETDDDEAGERISVKALFQQFVKWLSGTKTLEASGFKVLADNRWKIWYSNNYQDDEGEIFPAAKIDEFIASVKSGAYPYPVLQFAHLSGTDHGKADGLWRVGNFVLATGTFDGTPQASKWKGYHEALQKDGRKIGISHRYWYSPTAMQGGEYGSFQTFEISWFPVVPGVKPANPFTSMEVKTMPVQITAELRADMKKYGFTDAEINSLEATAQQLDERAIAERRAAKTQGGENTPATDSVVDRAAIDEAVKTAVNEAVQAARAEWEAAAKTKDDKTAADIQSLTATVAALAQTVKDGLALQKPASKSVWTQVAEEDTDVQDMKAAEAKKGKKRSVAEMMAGEHKDEMMD